MTDDRLFLMIDNENHYWIHNPRTGADVLLYHDDYETQPITSDEFKAARDKASELFPDDTILIGA
jgi:hypothetical protein